MKEGCNLELTKKHTKLIERKKESKCEYDQSNNNLNIASGKCGKQTQIKCHETTHKKHCKKTNGNNNKNYPQYGLKKHR